MIFDIKERSILRSDGCSMCITICKSDRINHHHNKDCRSMFLCLTFISLLHVSVP
jgi:hypothetical protein